MKLITLANLSTFAGEIKSKYATLTALEQLQATVDGIVATGGEANVLEGVKVNGTALTIADKMVDILVATGSENGTISVNNANIAVAGLKALAYKANISESDLDAALAAVIAGKANASDVYTKGEVDSKIAAVPQYDDTALAGRVTEVEGDIEVLNGSSTTAGSVDYKIAQAVASIMENPDETMNSINELVTWCNDHAADALELSNQVTTNKNDIKALTDLVGELPEGATSTTVVDYIAEAIGALGIGDYAKTSEVTAAINSAIANYYTKAQIDTKVEALEGSISTVDGKFASYYTKTEVDTKLGDYVLDSDIEAVTEAEVKALLA